MISENLPGSDVVIDHLKAVVKAGWKELADSPTSKRYTRHIAYPDKEGKFDNSISIKQSTVYPTTDTYCSYVIGSGKIIIDNGISTIMPVAEAMKKNLYDSPYPDEESVETAMNRIYLSDGVFINIDKNAEIKEPVEIIGYADPGEAVTSGRHLINVNENGHVNITCKLVNNGIGLLSNIIDVHLYRDAVLNLSIIYEGSERSRDVILIRIVAEDGSTINLFNGIKRSFRVHSKIDASLMNGASISYGNMLINDVDSESELIADIAHKGHDSKSETTMKSVTGASSITVLRGNIEIERSAVRSVADLKDQSLLLSDNAIANALPTLSIKTSEVKAKHKAAVEKIDNNKLFYMNSRGIDNTLAYELFKEAFIYDLVNMIKDAGTKKYIEDKWYRYAGH